MRKTSVFSRVVEGRRRRLRLLGVSAALLALATAGCGSSGPATGGSAGGSSVTAWLVSGGSAVNNTLTATASQFNASSKSGQVNIQYYSDASMPQKTQIAMTAGDVPPIIYNWGGGVLQQYVSAGDILPLTKDIAAHPNLSSGFLPSTLSAVTFNGKQYGVPIEGTQPVFFFYSKPLLKKLGLSFPQTWDQLMSDVPKIEKAGYIPISLGNAEHWEALMYLEYLTDRIGGPGVYDAIQAGKPQAWSNPAVLRALSMIQQMVKAGAFETGFNSVSWVNGAADALVYSGRAVFQLMGSWDVPQLLSEDANFVTSGDLGWAPFPTVSGGSGNPADLEGNTATYLSVYAKSTPAQQQTAINYMADELTSASFVKAEVGAGEVPVVKGANKYFAGAKESAFLNYTYNAVQKAPHFQYSWDQALGTAIEQPLYSNLAEVFALTETPQQFAAAMNATER